MNRVYLAVAMAITMLFSSATFAATKSVSIQLNTNLVSVHWNKHTHQHRKPKWQKHRVKPSQRIRHYKSKRHHRKPKHGYRAHKRIHRSAPRRYGKRHNTRRIVKKAVRHYLRHQARRYLNRHHHHGRKYH